VGEDLGRKEYFFYGKNKKRIRDTVQQLRTGSAGDWRKAHKSGLGFLTEDVGLFLP
jgi:hypothetical protein